jgi:ribose transport system substrate-binding protein
MKKISSVLILACASLGNSYAIAADNEVAIFTKNKTDPFFQGARAGADASAKRLGLKTVHFAPTKPNNLQEQVAQMEDATTRHPRGIAFVAVEPRGFKSAIDKARSEGIPVVNYIDQAEGNFNSIVVFDNKKLGETVTRHLIEKLGSKGNVVLIEGVKGSSTSDARTAGALEALKSAPGIKLLAVQPANYQRLQALQVMENLMQSHAQIDGVIAAADIMAQAAGEAMDGAGRKRPLIVGMDGTIEGAKAILNGKMLASGAFSGFNMGCLAVELIDRAAKKQAVPPMVKLDAELVNAANASAFALPLDQRKCLQLSDLGL